MLQPPGIPPRVTATIAKKKKNQGKKFVGAQTVTDDELEGIINEWVAKGWTFDGVQFAMRESSKRPAMAFVTFTRTIEAVSDKEG